MANENSVTIGKVIPTFKGDWNANTSYSALDVVVYKNTTYVAETDILTGTEPKDGTGEWSIMARGAIGPQGPQGERGKQVFKSSSEYYDQNSLGHWWSDLTPAVSGDNPPKIGDTIITSSGDVFQINTVNVGDGGGGGGTFGVGGLLGNIKGPQGPKGDTGDQGPKGDMDLSQITVGGRNLMLGTADFSGGSSRWTALTTVTTDRYRGTLISSSSGAYGRPSYTIQNAGILQVGKTYTFSIYARNTSDTDVIVARDYNANIVTPAGYEMKLPAHTDWTRVSSTFTVKNDPSTSTDGLRWNTHNSVTNGMVQFAGYKLEEGNVATDWTPAPDDVPMGLVVGGRNLLLGTADWSGGSSRWDLKGTVTTDTYRGTLIAATSNPWKSPMYLVQNAGILQVGKTYTFSTYVRNTSDTDTKVGYYYDAGISTQQAYSVALPAHTDWTRVFVTFKVLKDPTTSTQGLRWEGQNTLTNGQIQFAGYKLEECNVPTDWTPAPEDVNQNLVVGGRNYLTNSSGESLNGWTNNGTVWSVGVDATRGSVFISTPSTPWTEGSTNSLYRAVFSSLLGRPATVSFWAKASVENSKFHSESSSNSGVINPNLSTSWTRYSYYVPKFTGTIYFMGVDAGTTYYLDDIKLEAGNIATDWSPAPEDTISATTRGQILDGYDLNGYTDSYKYVINGAKNLVNYPSGASNWAALEVENINGNTATQTLKDSNSQVFIRSMGGNPAKWSAWRNVSDPGDPWKVVATAHFEAPKINNTSANSIVYYKFGSMVLADFHRENVTFSADIDTSLSNDITIVVDSGTIPPKDVNEWMAVPIAGNKVGVGVDAQATKTTSIRVRAIDGPMTAGTYVKMGTIMYHTNS